MSIRVTFVCGHSKDLGVNASAAVCACGETRIVRSQARAPRFVGVATGPYAEYKAMDAVPVNLAPGGSLSLKVEN